MMIGTSLYTAGWPKILIDDAHVLKWRGGTAISKGEGWLLQYLMHVFSLIVLFLLTPFLAHSTFAATNSQSSVFSFFTLLFPTKVISVGGV